MFDPSYNSAMQQMGFGDAPNCGKCGRAMTPENSKIRPELFLHDECLPNELKPYKESGMPSEAPVKHQAANLSVNDPTMIKIHVESCISSLRDEDGKCKSRELSLAVTKLQEATMWIDEHLRLS